MNKRLGIYMQNKRQSSIHTKKCHDFTLSGRHMLRALFTNDSPSQEAATRCPTHKNTKGKPFDFGHDG